MNELPAGVQMVLAGYEVAGMAESSGERVHEIGYVTLEPAGEGWTLTVRDRTGAAQLTCEVRGRRVC
jgi:hypothetical protein